MNQFYTEQKDNGTEQGVLPGEGSTLMSVFLNVFLGYANLLLVYAVAAFVAFMITTYNTPEASGARALPLLVVVREIAAETSLASLNQFVESTRPADFRIVRSTQAAFGVLNPVVAHLLVQALGFFILGFSRGLQIRRPHIFLAPFILAPVSLGLYLHPHFLAPREPLVVLLMALVAQMLAMAFGHYVGRGYSREEYGTRM